MKALTQHLVDSHSMTSMAKRRRLHEKRVRNARRFRGPAEIATFLRHKAREAVARPSPRPYVPLSPELVWRIADALSKAQRSEAHGPKVRKSEES